MTVRFCDLYRALLYVALYFFRLWIKSLGKSFCFYHFLEYFEQLKKMDYLGFFISVLSSDKENSENCYLHSMVHNRSLIFCRERSRAPFRWNNKWKCDGTSCKYFDIRTIFSYSVNRSNHAAISLLLFISECQNKCKLFAYCSRMHIISIHYDVQRGKLKLVSKIIDIQFRRKCKMHIVKFRKIWCYLYIPYIQIYML
jgi:hypothetical protein